ncbi:Transcription factor MBP1 [Basidiobolus ranarum]|uniref:Transcription factor MBP1 n=1 Tax=Basidiobolus ranarum TaxID=34480 RepID=A0ABR2X553_9FUNG
MTQIFKATYSGVPVYEMMCRGVAVMRRRHDSALNATQLLKVANFDKPQRTRILEREVQVGEHEKVQGGYGKYQGTWVPFERGVALATQYEVVELLRPLFDYRPNSESPPPAPKHTVNNSSRQRKKKEDTLDKEILQVSKPIKKAKGSQPRRRSHHETDFTDSSTTEPPTLSDTDSDLTSVDSDMTLDFDSEDSLDNPPPKRARGATNIKVEESEHLHENAAKKATAASGKEEPTISKHAGILREYFSSNSQDIPEIFRSPISFDINNPIDQDGSTCLHWASSTGRMALVKLLITFGGDIHSRNRFGHTPLVHSIFFPVNYNRGTFVHLVDLLLDSIGDYDSQNQTIFHHLCKSSLAGDNETRLYYLTCLLEKLAKAPKAKTLIFSMKDINGDTALDIANRSNESMAKLLQYSNTRPTSDTKNSQNLDKLLDEGYQRETVMKAISFRSGTRSPSPETQHHISCLQASRKILPSVTRALQDIETAHHRELDELNRQVFSTQAILSSVNQEIQEAQRSINSFQKAIKPYEQTQNQIARLENQLTESIQHRCQLQLEITELKLPDLKKATHSTNTDELVKEIVELRRNIESFESKQQSLISEMVKLARYQPSSDQPLNSEYKRVIAMCCDIPLETVDLIAQPLMEILALEDPFSQL